MNDTYLFQKAQQEAYKDIAQRKANVIPKPKTLTQISDDRKEEWGLEKIAPSTGYPELDYLIKGFVPGHLYTLTGGVNLGKTSLATNFADRVRRQKRRVLYFALEPENVVIDYLASVRLDKQFNELTQEDIEFDDDMIHVYGKAEVPNLDMLVKVIRESPLKYELVIVDHIGYFLRSQDAWVQEQSNAVKILAGLAKEKKIAIMIIVHLRKRASNQKIDYIPTADDISGSGAFKQDSTEVMIVVRPLDPTDENKLRLSSEGKLYVVKTKAGPNGAVGLIFSERKANIVSKAELEEKEKLRLAQNNETKFDSVDF